MNQNLKQLMLEAGYAAPELATRAQKLAQLLIDDFIKTVAAHGLMGDTALDAFVNLKRIYKSE